MPRKLRGMDIDRLSPHFRVGEFTRSQVASRLGIPNDLPPSYRRNAERLCRDLLEPIRKLVDCPIIISSGYRSPELNSAIGGSRRSQHCQGLAADLVVPGWSALDLCWLTLRSGLVFDQLIYEGTWTHISINPVGTLPRRSVLTAHFKPSGGGNYSTGLPPPAQDSRL